ncbi:MAG TPA: trypsin-like peptidase domain-containing protein [Xanthobacteraceae bacterium]|nr:trypsin-like peptidase domain-containing protein [Xanthobacteraceae bacterium]
MSGYTPARVDGLVAIQSYSDTIERIATLAGPDAASLFAEPVLPRGTFTPGAAISWYSSHEGATTELDAIDEVARKAVVERLTQRLEALSPALADPEVGPALSTWLNIASAKDILSVGGEPVLVDWGFLPGTNPPSIEERTQHFARTLGRFTSRLPLPPVDIPETATGPAIASAPASAPIPPAAAPALSMASSNSGSRLPPGSAGPAFSSDGPPPDRDRRFRPWLAPLIATIAAAIVLLILCLPGILIYPALTNSERDAFEARRLRASNDSLEDQLKALQNATPERVCRAPDPFVPVPQPVLPGSPPKPDLPMEMVPRDPQTVPVPPKARTDQNGTGTVADLLERDTVLVIAFTPPDHLSQGTGFFVNDRNIVTNHHVIAHADQNLVFVASKALGGARHAKVVAKSMPPPSERDLRVDLAVLEIEPDTNHSILKLGPTPPKLSTAYVAGYPGFLLSRDTQYQQFLQGLMASLQRSDNPDHALAEHPLRVPGADLRSGRINNLMDSGENSLPIIVHDMQLAQGNSGGPLVDACGRLAGINTLLFQNDQGAQQGNVAQDVSIVRKFLSDNNIANQSDETACQPATPQPPSAAQSPPAPHAQDEHK